MSSVYNNERDEEEQLLQDIELEMRKLHTTILQLFNNQYEVDSNDPLEKCCITNYCYSACLLQRGIEDKPLRNEDLVATTNRSLQRELDLLTSDLDYILKKIKQDNETVSSTDNYISNINKMIEACNNDNTVKKNASDTLKNIKMRFKREKNDLKSIITTLFSDNLEVQDLIARIIEHHFKEGFDKYLEVEKEDNIMEYIELLRRTNLFDINPTDVLQIKLADI
ncbi:hypothetical protein RUM44_009712 [Polyplax serrata]|uniref:Uncharacterized protein n=1 Tax=Polyplax serrata TaxID=468196 RepID=A0ABR1ATH6_POLSC